MPGLWHEAIVELLRSFPEFVAEAVRTVYPDLPQGRIRVESADLGELVPVERRADLALSLGAGRRRLSMVVEVQLRIDREKRTSWPGYLVACFRRTGAPTVLIVVTTSARIERWASRPIEVGPGFVLHPIVLGPSRLPPITSADEARRNPAAAVLSAMVHGRGAAGFAVGRAAAEACVSLDIPEKDVYFDLIFSSLNELARRALEGLMIQNYEFQSEFFRSRLRAAERASAEAGLQRGLQQGLEQGRELGLEQGRELGLEQGRRCEAVDAVLRVLSARGLEPSPAQRARVQACEDLALLERWLVGAATADSVDKALGEGP